MGEAGKATQEKHIGGNLMLQALPRLDNEFIDNIYCFLRL